MKESLRRWCEENSKPIEFFQHLCDPPKKISRGKKLSLKKPGVLEHLQGLAVPHVHIGKRHNRTPEEMNVGKRALQYKATQRIEKLSKPITRYARNHIRECPNCASPAALKHKATKRELALARPPNRRYIGPRDYTKISKAALKHTAGDAETRLSKNYKRNITPKYKECPPQYVKKAALSAEASPRTQELAMPKQRGDHVTKAHPFAVSRSAMKATPSTRTANLAKPKRCTPKYVNVIDLMWMQYLKDPKMCDERKKKSSVERARTKREQERRISRLRKRQERNQQNPEEASQKAKKKKKKTQTKNKDAQ